MHGLQSSKISRLKALLASELCHDIPDEPSRSNVSDLRFFIVDLLLRPLPTT